MTVATRVRGAFIVSEARARSSPLRGPNGARAALPGEAADLVVLRCNPTMDIANTSSIELVIAAGRRSSPS